MNSKANSFYSFAKTAQKIADSRLTNEKISVCKNYLHSLTDLEDRKIAIRFLGEGAFETISEIRLGIGHQTIAKAAADFLEIDYEFVFKACKTVTGSSSEAIEKLMEAWPLGIQKRKPEEIELNVIQEFFQNLLVEKKRENRVVQLQQLWQKLSAIEIKYFIRVMHQYSLRIGFEEKNILRALSQLYQIDLEEIRYAHMLTRSLEKTLEKCHKGKLETIQFEYFKPLAFMLASPLNQVKSWDVKEYFCEEKFDGMRCQAHVKSGEIKLFSRDMNDITATFPELKSFFLQKQIDEVILDGEICVFKDDCILPFQLLQKRMGVKKPSKALMEEFPVRFIGYDILAQRNDLLLNSTFTQRRARLEEFAINHHLPISEKYELNEFDDIQLRFSIAKKHGNEGLMLKKKDSIYEFGQRGFSWIKVKEPGGSLDTVILYAHAGSGKRGGLYSDFTLGVRSGVKEDGSPFFVPIGKAYGGYTDDELKWLNKEIRGIIADRFGPTLGLIPKIVVELEFEEVQQNKRTKAGYTLRLPRFKAIRYDLSIYDVDSLDDVKALFEEQFKKSRLTNSIDPFIQLNE